MDFCLDRASAFSFTCRVCGSCCSGKVIPVGPHEILGMSRILGVSTTEFLARHTDNGGTTLRSEADGRCVFVTPDGCQVHPRRPLVCRLYPLGRASDGSGEERFALFPKQAGCGAKYGTDGAVADFLESQGVGPYLEWSSRYGELYRRMVGLLDRLKIRSEVSVEDRPDMPLPEDGLAEAPSVDPSENRAPLSSWQDVDASLSEYCAARGLPVPAGIEEAIDLHIRAMGEWMDDLEARIKDGEKGTSS